MWRRFYTVAQAAARHGETVTGAKLFALSGEWEWALVYLSLSSLNSKMTEVTNNAAVHLSKEGHARLTALAEQLKKQSTPSTVTLLSEEQTELSDLSSWTFASPGYLAPMYSVLGETPKGMVKDGDVGLIDPLDTKDIEGYISGASRKTAGANFMRRTITNTISSRSLSKKMTQEESVPRTSIEDDFFASPKPASSEGMSPSGTSRKFSDMEIDANFSSDEEGSISSDFDRGGGRFGKKFRIQIKNKEEAHGGTSSEALREAAKNLRLGGYTFSPSLGPGGFAAAMKGGDGKIHRTESVSSISSSQSHQQEIKGAQDH